MRAAGSTAVHTGFWKDHDRDRIRGATLTISNPRAAALLAFLAILVTFAANRSWKICRYVLHRLMHTRQVESDVTVWTKRQQQVVLRNSETAGGALIAMLGISFVNGFSWSMVERVTWKSWLLKLFTVGHWLVFILLSILTSRIIIGRTVVSKVTDTCGIWEAKNMLEDTSIYEQNSWWLAYQEILYNTTMDSDNYVRNCYDKVTLRGFLDCNKFVVRSLPFFTEHDLLCPFEEAACLSAAFVMDSGNISFADLGINSKTSKDLVVRRRTTCSVLNEEIFRAGVKGPKDKPQTLKGDDRVHYYSIERYETDQNITFSYRNDNFTSAYDLRTHTWLRNPKQEMRLVKSLNPKGTVNDVSVLFLRGSGILFNIMHDDPWFAVHKKIVYHNDSGVDPSVEYYQMDRFVNMIGCEERAQFCSHRTGRCTPWSGLLVTDLTDAASFLTLVAGPDYNKTHQARERALEMYQTAVIIGQVLGHTAIPSSIQNRGHGALQATRFFTDGLQFRLNSEQWKLELEYWFQMALARLQFEIFNTIEKPPGLDDKRAHNSWNQEEIKMFCGSIKFQSPSHMSLSVAGILMVVLFSFTLTVASFIDVLLASSQLRGIFPITVVEWEKNENLALLNKVVNSACTSDDE
jgi:hypothetical protein